MSRERSEQGDDVGGSDGCEKNGGGKPSYLVNVDTRSELYSSSGDNSLDLITIGPSILEKSRLISHHFENVCISVAKHGVTLDD